MAYITISVILLGCIVYVVLGIYFFYKDTFESELYSKTNLNYIKGRSNYTFKIPEIDLNVTTSKLKEAQFYVMFSREDCLASLSDSIDYIKCITTDSNLNIIFNPEQKDSIYFWYSHVTKINQVKYNLRRLEDWDRKNFESARYRFFKPGFQTAPDTLRKPYIYISIIPSTYTIVLNLDSKNQERIKEGDIHGGW